MVPTSRKKDNGRRVMVVDDEPDIAHVLSEAIKLDGLAITPFVDPLQALGDFKRNRYDLVISDIKMPKMNGFDFYRELKKVRSDVPIWFMTAFEVTSREISTMFPSLKVERVIKKPVSAGKLRKMIQEEILLTQSQGITIRNLSIANRGDLVLDWSLGRALKAAG
jgi:DNA-binding response OmpR family regulator